MFKFFEYLTVYDKILIGIIILVSIISIVFPFFFLDKDSKEGVIIIKSSNKLKKIPLVETYRDEAIIYKARGPIGLSVIEAFQGKVRMKSSPCPDQICVHTGWIERAGPKIICVPNKIIIWIEKEENDIDGVSW